MMRDRAASTQHSARIRYISWQHVIENLMSTRHFGTQPPTFDDDIRGAITYGERTFCEVAQATEPQNTKECTGCSCDMEASGNSARVALHIVIRMDRMTHTTPHTRNKHRCTNTPHAHNKHQSIQQRSHNTPHSSGGRSSQSSSPGPKDALMAFIA